VKSDAQVVDALGPAGLPARVATWSMQRRFAQIALLVLVASSGIGGVAMYWAEAADSDEFRDERLELTGATLLNLAESVRASTASSMKTVTLPLNMRPTAARRYRYQIWSRDGALLLRDAESSASRPLTALSQRGFATVLIDNEEYRVLDVHSGDGALNIQIAESTSERWTDIAREMSRGMGYLLISYFVVSILAWLMMRRALRAIESLAHQLGHRSPLDLAALRIDNPPRELLPTLGAIDMLFARVGRALSSERQFTAVAAHEMRTPLAGLRAHAQLASAARDDAELQESLQAVRSGVDRVSHLLDQLLDLARLDALPAGSVPQRVRVHFSDVYQAAMVDVGLQAFDKRTWVSARFDVEEIYGHRGALSMLLRNLLANAILYSPEGGRVEVCCAAHEGGIALTVDDAGPGIRQADRQNAFERFNRLGQSRVNGVGLGLSIVLSVVELHGARIRLLDSPLGGLRVQVDFPTASRVADSPA
jgi:signal transduction histidine kinase